MMKQLNVEINALRAIGYHPEQAQDRRFADHYRQIKRPLIKQAMTAGAADARLILVASALPQAGKTFTSINLALSMARERDSSVLLVDGDAPKRHISRIFGLQDNPGLLDALVDESVPIESLVVETNLRGFAVLPAGTQSDGMSELLGSNRMRQIVADLLSANPRRIVLLDSAPLLTTSEGRALAGIAGQFVMVVRAGETPRQAVQEAVGVFGGHISGGLLLNDSKEGIMDRYYGYGGYGSYGADDDGTSSNS